MTFVKHVSEEYSRESRKRGALRLLNLLLDLWGGILGCSSAAAALPIY